jgi:hypothetical protein
MFKLMFDYKLFKIKRLITYLVKNLKFSKPKQTVKMLLF